jgi:hypothetical protein
MTLSRSLSKLRKTKTTKIEVQAVEDNNQRFLEKKFLTS